MNKFKCQFINSQDTLPIRQRVFRPNKSLAKNQLREDESAIHAGIFNKEILIGVVSVFVNAGQARVRKLATLPEFRRQHVATKLMAFVECSIKEKAVQSIWLLAVQHNECFYHSIGFETVEKQEKRGGLFLKMKKYL